MAFEDLYRMGAHGVITNEQGDILLVKASYGALTWGLPGGGIDPGETGYDSIIRECKEELGRDIIVENLTGIYYHSAINAHVFIFRCHFTGDGEITLSSEHSEYRYFSVSGLDVVQQRRVEDCLNFNGTVAHYKF